MQFYGSTAITPLRVVIYNIATEPEELEHYQLENLEAYFYGNVEL